MPSDHKSLDLVGLGKIAEAIPDEVYIKTADSALEIVDKALSPLVELTSGLGLLIRQKFETMVEMERALGAITIENAVKKARQKALEKGIGLIKPIHEKSFIKSIEEAARESDPILHDMWENLLANQLINVNFHPNFVNILSSISPEEAKILVKIKNINEVGETSGGFFLFTDDGFKNWVTHSGDMELREWNYPCVLLYEYRLIDLLSPKEGVYKQEDAVVILYRTKSGDLLLDAVK
ncbi:Abi-alpha family protein [Alkalispirochaeta alkalica]|uniref:Abi-alpha family protein n=1 Tax=Alkalispirochaeta alkalica TaxID=46356 RepID=UPI000A06AFA7|nr:Abi-alpha family protein [Alkalispirochaeta alkalica]